MKKICVPIIIVILFLLAFVTSDSIAGPGSNLRGVYTISGIRTCVQTAELGFNETSQFQLNDPATTRTYHVKGLLTLNGNGTGTLTARMIQINHQNVNVGNYPLTVTESVCTVEYKPLPDGTLEMKFPSCPSRVLIGFGAPYDANVQEPVVSVSISSDRSLLLFSDTEPDIEFVSTVPFGNFERICGRNLTGILLSPIPGR